MDYVKIRTHITDHDRFLEAGKEARDLWTWGMLYAGRHETDGEIAMSAVLASPWGAGGRANARVAAKLVDVGLWERTDRGYRVARWAEQGNLTRAEIQTERSATRDRVRKYRESCKTGSDVTRYKRVSNGVSNAFVPTSYSSSDSDLKSRSEEPDSSPRADARDRAPAEPPTKTRRVDRGGALMAEAKERFVDAVAGVTGDRYVWPPEPWHFTDMQGVLQHAPDGLSATDLLGWLGGIVASWVRSDQPTEIAPKTLLRWLNAGRRGRAAQKRGAEITRQPFDPDAPWLQDGYGEVG